MDTYVIETAYKSSKSFNINIYNSICRNNLSSTSCCLCGKEIILSNQKDITSLLCSCKSSHRCKDCAVDIVTRSAGRKAYGFTYICETHGKYRHYEDLLIYYKSWCIVWVSIAVVPYGLIVITSGVNLFWVIVVPTTFMCPFLAPLFLSITWSKSTAPGVTAGNKTYIYIYIYLFTYVHVPHNMQNCRFQLYSAILHMLNSLY